MHFGFVAMVGGRTRNRISARLCKPALNRFVGFIRRPGLGNENIRVDPAHAGTGTASRAKNSSNPASRCQSEVSRGGYTSEELIIQAPGRRRLRPIVMTALAAVAGMMPLALAIGAGSQIAAASRNRCDRRNSDSMALSLIITPAMQNSLTFIRTAEIR